MRLDPRKSQNPKDKKTKNKRCQRRLIVNLIKKHHTKIQKNHLGVITLYLLLLALIIQPVMAQSPGLGVVIPFPLSRTQSIGMVFPLGEDLALRPTLSFSLDTAFDPDNTDAGSNTNILFGLRPAILYTFLRENPVNLYTGAALILDMTYRKIGNADAQGSLAFGLSPLLGSELRFTPRFGVFGELGLDFLVEPRSELSNRTIISLDTYTTQLGVMIYLR